MNEGDNLEHLIEVLNESQNKLATILIVVWEQGNMELYRNVEDAMDRIEFSINKLKEIQEVLK